jgi:hypothetical protein
MDELLKALQGNLGLEPSDAFEEEATLPVVIRLARRWQDGELATDLLLSSVDELQITIDQAVADTARDLRTPMVEELAGALQALAQGFVALRMQLELLRAEVLAQGSLGEIVPNLERLRHEIAAQRSALQDWLQQPIACCPRCGSREEDPWCPDCQLDRLIPDPEPSSQVESAQLGPDYAVVYNAYRAVLAAERPLAPLFETLGPLERKLSMVANLSASQPDLHEAVLACLGGMTRMRRAATTRALRDLNQGWAQLFRGGARLAELYPALLRTLGRREEAEQWELKQGGADSFRWS